MNNPENLWVIPHLRIQNANAISGNLTWGFPAMSAFVGLMHALERKAQAAGIGILFDGVGVVCHHHEAQVSRNGYVYNFNLTRNPVDKSGDTAAIVEEGRIHLDVTLVFALRGANLGDSEAERAAMAQQLMDLLEPMRVAGGSIVSSQHGDRRHKPWIVRIKEDPDEQYQQFLSLRRRLLPGFALVLRDDLLQKHHQELLVQDSDTTLLDAWLDLSRLNMICEREVDGTVEWTARSKPGWLVPIPIGYSALSELYKPGDIARARDTDTPFRFVESLYSIGQWISPHRLQQPGDLLWYVDNDLDQGLYRLNNLFNEQQQLLEEQES